MTTTVESPASTTPLPPGWEPVDHFAAADAAPQPGEQLRLIREAAPRFRDWLVLSGCPDFVGTYDLVSLPYPTRFGLFRAARTPVPYLTITNRLVVVRWHEPDGRPQTLLFEPSDVELGANTPYFRRLAERAARLPGPLRDLQVRYHGTVTDHLARLGIAPGDVDWITFDHLHTQDVRRWLGTNSPAPDLSPQHPVEPVFPNARLVVQRTEMEALRQLHPLQRPWYQPDTYTDLRQGTVLEIDGDVRLGPGIALLRTPGHTIGNHTLVLNTAGGVWASSENVVAAECLTPEHSRIPGVRAWAEEWGQEVVLNANTLEATAQQYNSAVKEKLVVDRSAADPRFLQFFPSSELTASPLAIGARPTFVHRGIFHGALGRS